MVQYILFSFIYFILLLFLGGQDSIVRIWRLEPPPANTPADDDKDLEVKDQLLEYSSEQLYRVQLESVLCGHEDKVYHFKYF